MNLCIAGSRTFDDYDLLCRKLDRMLSTTGLPDLVVSGTCRGGDLLGEQWATEHGVPIQHMPADWQRYGKRAGFVRNAEMAKVATHVVVFVVDGSRGAAMMADISQKAGLPTRIVRV